MATEYNTNGLGTLQQYGTRTVDEKRGGIYASKTGVKTAEWTFDYDDLPVGGQSKLELSIPANASIVSTKLEIIAAFTSTSTLTDLLIGLEQADSTAIDVDGLFAGTESTEAAIAIVGNIIDGAGALVGKTVGAAAGELIVAGSVDDLLTGKARVLVEYI